MQRQHLAECGAVAAPHHFPIGLFGGQQESSPRSSTKHTPTPTPKHFSASTRGTRTPEASKCRAAGRKELLSARSAVQKIPRYGLAPSCQRITARPEALLAIVRISSEETTAPVVSRSNPAIASFGEQEQTTAYLALISKRPNLSIQWPEPLPSISSRSPAGTLPSGTVNSNSF